jgi:transposase-like protein
MTKPYSDDLRERVVAAMQSGGSCRSVAARFGVAPSSVVKWTPRAAQTGSVWPAADFVDTEIGCFNGIGVFHGETEVQPRVRA